MKFLDLTGVQSLWNAIKAETAKSKTTVEGESAHQTNAYVSVTGAAVTGSGEDGHTNYVVSLHNAASTSDVTAAKEALYGGTVPSSNAHTLTSLDSRIDTLESGSAVTITENTSGLDSGVLKSYTFTQAGSTIGTVNIPKDFLVKSGQVREITAAEATNDMPEGTKVLDFTVNTIGGDETASHIIIPVTDLVDVYTGGNGINVSNTNVISAVLDTTGDDTGTGEFLTLSASGIKLDGVSDAIAAAKSEVIGTSSDTASADTIEGAKAYADDAIATATGNLAISAAGDAYVTAAVDSSNNKKINVAATQSTKDSLALADSALQGVDSTQQGSNVKVTLGTSGKNVTVSVDETALGTALGGKADKVTSATNGNFAGLDSNGNLTDSGSKASDFATAAQGTKADSAIQSVTGETAVSNSNYVAVSVEASTNSTTKAVTLTSHANVTTQAMTSADGSHQGLAEASDVKSYVDTAIGGINSTIAAMDADLDASGTAQHSGTFVMSGVTEVDGVITAVDSVEVEAAGAAAAAEAALRGPSSAAGYVANDTLAALRNDINSITGGSGSIATQISSALADLDSDVNASSATSNHVTSTNTNTTTNASATPVANVLTSITITDGILTAATGETIGAITTSELEAIFNPSTPGE